MIKELKDKLTEIIKERSTALIGLTHSGINIDVVNDEIDTIRKLKDAYDKLEEVC